MKFKHPRLEQGELTLALRERYEIENGVFEIPDERAEEVADRLVEDGCEVLDEAEAEQLEAEAESETGASDDDLDELDRSDLYQLAKEEYGLDVEWQGSTKESLLEAIREARAEGE